MLYEMTNEKALMHAHILCASVAGSRIAFGNFPRNSDNFVDFLK